MISVESVKNGVSAFIEFDGDKNKVSIRLLQRMNEQPSDWVDASMEPFRMMYRMFSRFIYLAQGQPIEELRPSHKSINKQTSSFLNSMRFKTNDICKVKLEGPNGKAMEALFFVLSFFLNYRETRKCFKNYEDRALEECTIEDLKRVHRKLYYKDEDSFLLLPFWNINWKNPCEKLIHDQNKLCINLLLMLYLSVFRFYFDVSDREELLDNPPMQEIFRISNAIVSQLPYGNEENLGDIAKQGTLEPLMIFEIISVLNCVLKAESVFLSPKFSVPEIKL